MGMMVGMWWQMGSGQRGRGGTVHEAVRVWVRVVWALVQRSKWRVIMLVLVEVTGLGLMVESLVAPGTVMVWWLGAVEVETTVEVAEGC